MTDSEQTSSQIRTTNSESLATNARALMVAVLCLVVVLLVMAFGLVYATTIAGAAQDSAERQEHLNDQLREELSCRAQGSTDFDLAMGHLQASIGRALLLLGQGSEDAAFAEALGDIAADIDDLEAAAVVREQTLSNCTSQSTGE